MRTLFPVIFLLTSSIATAQGGPGGATSPPETAPRVQWLVLDSEHGADADQVRAALGSLTGLPVQFDGARLPASEPSVDQAGQHARETLAAVARARQAYVDGEFEGCLQAAGDLPHLRDLLGRGSPDLVARRLFWRVACLHASGRSSLARRAADAFWTLGLPSPPDLGVAAPDVEQLLIEVSREVQARKPVTVTLSSQPPGRISVDGRAGSCRAPCPTRLPPGLHLVRAEADGHQPVSLEFEVRKNTAPLILQLPDAPPELAARQWHARHATSPSRDSRDSLRLLARATRARRLAVLLPTAEAAGMRLQGALLVDGKISARSEQAGLDRSSLTSATRDVVQDLLVMGKVVEKPPLVQRPVFWVSVAAAAAAAAGLTAALLHETPVRVEVGF